MPSPINVHGWTRWLKKHVRFGFSAFLGAALIEINTRVDVIMLGLFASDREGIIQFMVVVRTNVNPILTSLFTSNKIEELKETIQQGIKLFYPVMIGIGLVAIGLFPIIVNQFFSQSDFVGSWPVFLTLMIGVVISAGYFPFNMLLMQAGYAFQNTLLIALIVLCNVLLNAFLIPLFGILGAAIATSISFVLGMVLLKLFVQRILQLKI